MAEIPIVDTEDKVLYYEERGNISMDEIYRVSACWITNLQWDILLAQRSFSKKNSPGKRWPAVAGTVTWRETYLENIIHEIPEEIGIELNEENLSLWPYYLREWEHKFFCQLYLATIDLPIEAFTKEEWEVEEIRRFSQDELRKFVIENPEKIWTVLTRRESLFLVDEWKRVDTLFEEPVPVDKVITELNTTDPR